ncbi:thiolase family protein [Vogesella oryzae]|uniref:thiolase family protein n=1 Tax=Vogesella oryzae TaxID=1735285 RepID=UPI00158215D0|nr:thiolase family protein [Vogesella oryzae]
MLKHAGVFSSYADIWLLHGQRTPFVDYNGALAAVSPTDLGIHAARATLASAGIPAGDVGHVFAGNMAQASFDAYMLPRHIALYAGTDLTTPATLTQRVCGTGIELLLQAADRITLGQIALGLCVGAESMSRNPIAAYGHRGGFRLGQVEFKDFLWEALFDPAANVSMGDTAEKLARQYGIPREQVDRFAEASFHRALAAREAGFFDGELCAIDNCMFELAGYQPRRLKLAAGHGRVTTDSHLRPSPYAELARIRPAFGGVQTAGNSSAIVDGAAAALVASGDYRQQHHCAPLARIVAGAVIGVPPEIMGIGPAPAIRRLLQGSGLSLADIDRFEINEAFGAQCLAVMQELGLDHQRVNVNGGAIAIGHPLAASGLRLSITLARELQRCNGRFGIASACIGGGQGIALLLENPACG